MGDAGEHPAHADVAAPRSTNKPILVAIAVDIKSFACLVRNIRVIIISTPFVFRRETHFAFFYNHALKVPPEIAEIRAPDCSVIRL
jgi:hypothetical protein